MNSQCEHLCSIIFFVVAAAVAPFVIERDGNLGIVDKNFISARTKDKLLWLPLLALWWVFFLLLLKLRAACIVNTVTMQFKKWIFFPVLIIESKHVSLALPWCSLFFLPLSWSLCYPYNFLNDMPLFLSHVIPNKKKLCDVWYYSGVIRMQNATRCVSTV